MDVFAGLLHVHVVYMFDVVFPGIAGLCSVAVIAVDRYVVVCRPMGAVMFQTRSSIPFNSGNCAYTEGKIAVA